MTTASQPPSVALETPDAPGVPVSRRALREQVELHRIRRWGLTVLAVQLVALVLWSVLEANRAVLGYDFAGCYQAWYLISHGVLGAAGFWKAQGIFIIWPLAIFGLLWPHPITLLVIQDLAIVGAEAVAFSWLTEIIRARRDLPFFALSSLGLLLLVADPWIYWSASWDYHSEAVGTLFAILAARDLSRGRKRGWIWSGLTLLSGMVPATYLAGIGLGLLFKRKRRLPAFILIVGATVWFLVLTKLGAGGTLPPTPAGSSAASQRLAGQFVTDPVMTLLRHGFSVFANPGSRWVDTLANVSPSGLLGVFTAPFVGVAAVVLGENGIQSYVGPITPSFQNLPIYMLTPVGTVLALSWLHRRFGARLARALMLVAGLNVVGWGVVWIPQIPSTWLRVSPTAASVLNRVEARIPEQDGVVASQGVVGDFAGRKYFSPLYSWPPFRVRVVAPATWFVVAPYAGIETETVVQSLDVVDRLASDPRARLVLEDDGIWVFRLSVPQSARPVRLSIPKVPQTLPAALFETAVGTRVLTGPLASWHLQSNGTAGQLLFNDYWLEGVGRYQASVRLRCSGFTKIEVWDTTTNTMLAKRRYRSTRGTVNANLEVQVTSADPYRSSSPGSLYYGVGPFRVDPVPAAVGNSLEVKVIVRSGVRASVYSVSMRPIATP
jgi:hypothetical protein